MFQALALVRAIATRGSGDAWRCAPSLASIFRIDADKPGRRLRRHRPTAPRPGNADRAARRRQARSRAHAHGRIGAACWSVKLCAPAARRWARCARESSAIARQTAGCEPANAMVTARLAQLYADTLSRLRPRIVVEGNPQFLRQAAQVSADPRAAAGRGPRRGALAPGRRPPVAPAVPPPPVRDAGARIARAMHVERFARDSIRRAWFRVRGDAR